jgi:hypothetical protein
MRTARRTDSPDQWIRLELAKGVLLLLTQDEYVTALQRGKAERRAVARAKRLAQTNATQEAKRLQWIE